MPLIKRYPNRKLYDTQARQYVSLDDVARLIRQGQEVQVIDHATGDDLTTLTLVQIIAEQEKQRNGFLPLSVLQGLIQSGGAMFADGGTFAGLRRSLAAPLDLLRQVDEEIQRRVEKLMAIGELAEDEGRRLIQRLLALDPGAAEGLSEDRLMSEIAARKLATRSEVAQLAKLIEELTARVETLQPGNSPSAQPESEDSEPTGIKTPS